jgi:hypothetical protein
MGERGPGARPLKRTAQQASQRIYDARRALRKAEGDLHGVRLNGRRILKLRRVIAGLPDEVIDVGPACRAAIPEATPAEIAQACREELAEAEAELAEAKRR